MRKISRAAALALSVCISALLLAVPKAALAADTYKFYYNDELWTFSASTPVDIQNEYTCLPMDRILQRLGGTYTYDDTISILTVYLGGSVYNFNVDTGMCSKDGGEQVYAPAFFQAGTFYFPMEYIAEEVSALFVHLYGSVYRLQTNICRYTEAQLITAGAIRWYEEQQDVTRPTYYLLFVDQPNSYTESILNALDANGITAAFFMSEQRMRAYPELVRRIVAAGHATGLVSDGSVSSVTRANQTYQRITKQRAVLAYESGSAPAGDLVASLEGASYRVWQANIKVPDFCGADSVMSARSEFTAILPLAKIDSVVAVSASRGAAEFVATYAAGAASGSYNIGDINEFAAPLRY